MSKECKCTVLESLFSEVAKERGRDPEELKQLLLQKIREEEQGQ